MKYSGTEKLSRHFALWEVLISRTAKQLGIVNTPPPQALAALVETCRAADELRDTVGALRVSSGFRCEKLNDLVGGAKRSYHRLGLALDLVPREVSVRELMIAAVEMPLVWDQVIFEKGRWVHVQRPRYGRKPRGLALMTLDGRKFEPWDPNDPRTK